MVMIALLQLNPTVGDLEGNMRRIITAVERAAKAGAQLCLTPELALIGYPPRDLLFQHGMVSKTHIIVDRLAHQLYGLPPVILGAPSRNLTDCGKPFLNCALALADGHVIARYAKKLLPTYDVFDESRYFEPGTDDGIVNLAGLRLGLTICEDIWNDKDYWNCRSYTTNPLEDFAGQNLDAIVNISASPFVLGKQAQREDMLGTMARKYSIPLLYANQVGGNDDLVFDGHSAAFDDHGNMIARAAGFAEAIILVELTPQKKGAKITKNEDPGTTLHPTGDDAITPNNFNAPVEAWQALVLGTHDYAVKCGFSRALLGLSGGIDSSLTAAIAAAALGPDQVLGVLMPSPYSSQGSVEDAMALSRNLGLKTLTLPINNCMQAFDRTLAPIFSDQAQDVAKENLQARIRGNLLMALSNKYSALLLTTGNKTELAIGYCTIYGDMCGGLAVISDVPKTLVYAICHWLNAQRGEVVPLTVLTKAPSAELKPGQLDQDSLPPYKVLDAILERHLEKGADFEDLTTAGFEPEMVRHVLNLVQIAEFKRRQAAPGLKITDRAFGTGWRMPLACRIPS
ncbi:Glutamine-dependent NAD(+) synthetase [Desulfovibrionales bacterium]